MEEKKRDVKINPNRVEGGEFARNIWIATVQPGVTREDIMKPDFWSHAAWKFKPYERIEVRSDNDAFFVELLILSCDRTWAKVYELSFHSLSKESTTQNDDEMSEFEVLWKGPTNKWSVIRKSDGAVIKNKMDKEEARAFKLSYEKSIAA